MIIVGLMNSHDGGYAVLEDGVCIEHTEFERYTRIKESGGDSLKLLEERFLAPRNMTLDDVDQFVSPMPTFNLERSSGRTYDTHERLPKDKVKFYSHHLCHAANSYFSSPYDEAISISIDNAGMETDSHGESCTIYLCKKGQMKKIFSVPSNQFSLGDLWGRMTRWVFKLWSGYPRGHQAGSVMAMAALGDSEKYYEDLQRMMGPDHKLAVTAPPNALRGVYVPPEEEVVHPYLDKYRKIAEDDQEKYHLAAALQRVTEEFFAQLVSQSMKFVAENGFDIKNICFSGGVCLNSVALGKIAAGLPEDWSVFLPPVPYDGGLSIGAAQYHYHSMLGNPKVYNEKFCSPYLGETYKYEDLKSAKEEFEDQISLSVATSTHVARLLSEGNIVSVYYRKSESGRRALGNRSILANPAIPEMKQMINDKVKHRQWYRPFAPSVLGEYGEEWFENYFHSPYMGFVFKIKPEKVGVAPAIEHFDQTARIQSVTRETNHWYYDLIREFHRITGVPLVLNTSFNDREPIVETPRDAIKCFLGTDIDYLYFAELGHLVKKNES
jgi:carbamoyltransferase